MSGVITASEPSWIAPFTGLSPRQFGRLVTALRRELGLPIRFIGVGESLEDLEPFDPRKYAEHLLTGSA